MAPPPTAASLTVALTGPRSALGRGLRARLEEDDRVAGILCLDLEPDAGESAKSSFARVDLTQPGATQDLARAFTDARADALVHLAFLSAPVRDPAYAHELEAIGTLHAFAACEAARVLRVVMPSSTMVYGASPSNPGILVEDRALLGNPRSRFVCDRIEAEQQARRFAAAHPEARVAVLRLAPLFGPLLDNPITRLFGRRIVPTVLGYDPLFQALHITDAVASLALALFADSSGAFNLAGDGVLPLSGVVRLCGGVAVPLPHPFARTLLRALDALGIANVPPSLLDYLQYGWIGDGRRARDGLGFKPHYSTRAAVLDFARARTEPVRSAPAAPRSARSASSEVG